MNEKTQDVSVLLLLDSLRVLFAFLADVYNVWLMSRHFLVNFVTLLPSPYTQCIEYFRKGIYNLPYLIVIYPQNYRKQTKISLINHQFRNNT